MIPVRVGRPEEVPMELALVELECQLLGPQQLELESFLEQPTNE